MATNYYGKQGPTFILKSGVGSGSVKVLQSPNEISENPWKRVQQQNRDINNILRLGELQYEYSSTMTWIACDTTLMTNLVTICNWQTQEGRDIIFYPFSDKPYIKFPIVVTVGSPSLFSKVPYDSFTITVTSKNILNRLPNPDADVAIDMDGAISIDSDLTIET